MNHSLGDSGPTAVGRAAEHARLRPYVPRILADWLRTTPDAVHREVEGTLLFADISGFTKLTERLSRLGNVGAEEMSDALNATFGQLLTVASVHGADLVKWGGDAVLLLFDGPDHAARACRTAYDMRARLRAVGHLSTSAGQAQLRMSQGIHSGRIQFFLVGDRARHRELLVCGPDVTAVVEMEGVANAGQIAVGASTCALLDERLLGTAVGTGRLLRRRPDAADEVRAGVAVPQQSSANLAVGLPTAIRQHLLQGQADPEHRTIAVGFVAFSGTDRMLAEEGPEATAAALDACVRNVAGAVADHGVTFFESDVNADGGKIMLTAGAPTSAGRDAERLLRAARLIVERAGDLPLRVGVNTGNVFSGDFGPAFRRTYSVKGDAINLAARLVARATPGQVLATTRVVEQSPTTFVTEALPPFTVKGKRRPVTAVDVGPPAEPANEVHAPRAVGPLVGRAAEMEVLTAAVDGLRGRRGGLVQVVGDAGIGKTRLLAETAARAGDMTVLSVQCDEYESSTPYHSLRALLRQLLGVRSRTDPRAARDRLLSRVSTTASELVPWLPLVGAVVGVPVPETEQTRELDGEFRKRRLEMAVGEFLHATLPTPALVLVDDGQFLDGASADLLAHLVSRTPEDPWLFVVARRDDSDGALPTGSGVTVRPEPLSAQDSVRLLQAVADGPPLPRPTAVALAGRAAGNPLFLESLRDVAAPAAGSTVLELPMSVQELVTAQIDELPPVDRSLLRHASVLGMRFRLPQLAELAAGVPPDETTFRRLDRFVVAEAPGVYRFRHGLMRDVAYAGLPFRTRRRLHESVAERLEASAAEASPELLSLHFFHAGTFEKAWHYSVVAGRRAMAKFANQEAVELLTRGVDAERRCARGTVPAAEVGRVLEEIGDTWFIIGLPEQAADAYRRARRHLAGDPVEAARIVAKEARIDHRLRQLPQSLRRVSRALHQLEQVPGRWASSARSLLAMRYAISRFSQGWVDEAIAWGQRAARDAEESVDKATLAQAYGTLHGIYVTAGLEPPMPYGELSLQAYTELGDLPHQADCINNLAVSALDHNRWVEAADSFGRAAAIYRQIGDTQGEGLATYNHADVLLRQGHLEESLGLLSEALVTARSVSDSELVALCLRESGRVLCRRGEIDEGTALIEQARAMFVEIDEPEELPATEIALGEACLLAGHPAAALAATDLLLEPDDPVTPARHRVRGFALMALDRPDAAEHEFRTGLDAAVELDDRYARALNLLGLGALEREPGAAAEAAAALDGLGVVAVPVAGATLDALQLEGLVATST